MKIMLENYLNKIICDDNLKILKDIEDNTLDLVVTSPPYDSLREYNGYIFDFDRFKIIAKELFRIIKKGGIVVWVVGDETIEGGETGTSFRQALYFQEIGFLIHDTMIYEKTGLARPSSNRCHQAFEYMFVFSKGKLNTFNHINDKLTTYPSSGKASTRQKDGSLVHSKHGVRNKKYGGRFNIWRYKTGKGLHTKDEIAYIHSAIFPEELARDHIYMWSNEGDIVLDPFNGSGTTTKMAYLMHRRYIGVDCSQEYCDIAEKRIKMHKDEQHHNEYWKCLLNPLEKQAKYGLTKYSKK